MLQTLEDFLYAADPSLASKRTSQNQSHSETYLPKWPRTIRKWRDFDVETMRAMGSGILERVLKLESDFMHCTDHPGHHACQYDPANSEAALEGRMTGAVQDSVNCALLRTHEYTSRDDVPQMWTPGIAMFHGPQARCIPIEEEPASHYKPDWAGCFPVVTGKDSKYSGEAPITCLPGDTKLRWKVDFDLLNKEVEKNPIIDFSSMGRLPAFRGREIDPTKEKYYSTEYRGLRLALIQLYSYCYESNCRYGYIITEGQLLVMRIRPRSREGPEMNIKNALKEEGLLEYRTISYNQGDRSKHSVTSALWWLHILASIDHKIRWWYSPLAELILDSAPSESQHRCRDASEEYKAPLDNQLVEAQPCDRRLPAPTRKSETQHSRAKRKSPLKPKKSRKASQQSPVQDHDDSPSNNLAYQLLQKQTPEVKTHKARRGSKHRSVKRSKRKSGVDKVEISESQSNFVDAPSQTIVSTKSDMHSLVSGQKPSRCTRRSSSKIDVQQQVPQNAMIRA